jgi:hypothetical protein
MRDEFFVCRYKDGKFIDKSPYGMNMREAESLADLCMQKGDGFTYKVKVVWADGGLKGE